MTGCGSGELSLHTTSGQGGPRICSEELWVGVMVMGAAAAESGRGNTGLSYLLLPPLTLPDATQQGHPDQAQWASEAGEDCASPRVGAGAFAWGVHAGPPSLHAHLPGLPSCPTDCSQPRGASKLQIPALPPMCWGRAAQPQRAHTRTYVGVYRSQPRCEMGRIHNHWEG